MTRQLAFDLPHREARGRGDFFVSDSNAAALEAVDGFERQKLRIARTGPNKAHESSHDPPSPAIR